MVCLNTSQLTEKKRGASPTSPLVPKVLTLTLVSLLLALGGYLGGLIATWTYLPWDGPMYPIGNGLNLAVASTIGISSLLGLFWMNADNKKRDQKTPAEREELLAGMSRQEISDLDWRHPDFRWRP